MDTSFGAGVMSNWITENLGCDIIGRGQTMPQQVEEYERFMEGLRSGWLHHSGDAGLTSHAMNAIARHEPPRRHGLRPAHARSARLPSRTGA